MNASEQLERRVADLDQRPGNPASGGLHMDIAHFIDVMQQVVPPGTAPEAARVGTLTAVEADRLQHRCRLLNRLAAEAPQIVDGPIDAAAQYWVATGKPPELPEGDRTPRESSFIPASRTAASPARAKPFDVGLFTSTGTGDYHGMWRSYLRGYEGSTSMFLMPWYTWRLQPYRGARVYEIRDATHWVHLIANHPRTEGGFLHPDWASIANTYDAVHITLRAITAAQGLSFTTEHGPTIAPYWDVETTFWLNWSFTMTELVEVTSPPGLG